MMRPQPRHHGRHRQPATRRTTARRLGACAVLAGATGLGAIALAGSAAAESPVQTGWWNTASGGGQAAPSPTTPEGGLHIAAAPGEVLAFGAVLYTMPEGATATLELTLSNAQGTPELQACPTKSVAWKAGDNQPADSEPDYDCSLKHLRGLVSADGKTVTFLLDDGAEVVPGMLSLAIVPIPSDQIPAVGGDLPVDSTQPFSVDIDKPSATSLTVTGGAPVTNDTSGDTTTDGTTTTSHSGGSSSTSSSGGASTGTAGGGGNVPVPPDLGGQTTTQATNDSGTAPVVAPSDTTAAPQSAPAAAAAPTTDNRAHNAALAMLVLIGLGIAGMSNGQLQRSPRLLGGGRHAAGRGVGAGAAAGAAAQAMPAAMAAPYGVRGLGRFSKPRDTPARPLI